VSSPPWTSWGGDADDTRGVEPAGEVEAERHIGDEVAAHDLLEDGAVLLGILGVALARAELGLNSSVHHLVTERVPSRRIVIECPGMSRLTPAKKVCSSLSWTGT
jgi:hypothetical protein